MPKPSAGIMLYRRKGGETEVLLVHPGGPFWAKKDDGAWSLPKGEYKEDEDPLAGAKREFAEETGAAVPEGELLELGSVQQKSGKVVHAWAVEGDFDPATLKSNTLMIMWPPFSGRKLEIPEVDRAEWFGFEDAKRKLNPAQAEFVDRLTKELVA